MKLKRLIILWMITISFFNILFSKYAVKASNNKLVTTYFFYWYDIYTSRHIINPDGTDALTDHPKDMKDFSYNSVNWFKKELKDMTEAGIDIVLPVYWGSSQEKIWSYYGLKVMSKAMDELTKSRVMTPKVGMFYDTTALWQENGGIKPDLTSKDGRKLFYSMIRDFFTAIPKKYWAFIDNKPIVWLYSAGWVGRYSQDTFDFVRNNFKRDFGYDLYIVGEISWSEVKLDNWYAWGAALNGPSFFGVGCVGPGYDDSAVPGRTTPKRERENGKFYENSWKKLLIKAKEQNIRIVAIETWNEFHEGTDIAESREYGRKYIELTRKYVDMFKKGVIPKDISSSPYASMKEVSIVMGNPNLEKGLQQIDLEDGITKTEKIGDVTYRYPIETKWPVLYIYIRVDDDFLSYADTNVNVTIEYLDKEKGWFRLDYDSNDIKAILGGAYTPTETVNLVGDGKIKSYTFTLKRAKFANRENGGSDFRIATNSEGLYISKIIVSK
jgi:hypothetical protein